MARHVFGFAILCVGIGFGFGLSLLLGAAPNAGEDRYSYETSVTLGVAVVSATDHRNQKMYIYVSNMDEENPEFMKGAEVDLSHVGASKLPTKLFKKAEDAALEEADKDAAN